MSIKRLFSSNIKAALIGGLLVAISFIGFGFSDNYFEISKNLDIFASLFREINTKYVDETNPGKLVKTAIDGMLEELDPFTNFISESELEDLKFMTTGQYGGIGALIQQRGDYVLISEPYEGFPAQKAGLQAGDKILEVDGRDIKGKTTSEVSSMLKGQPNTVVKLKIERNGELINKEIERKEIKIDDIPYYGVISNDIGYIKLNGFTDDAGAKVRSAFEKLKSEHNIKNIILDLRGNGGGLLREAVNIVNVWVKKDQEVVTTRGRMPESAARHLTSLNPSDEEMPLIVLVDRGSASASEIVSGSIQDLDRGIVIGQRTYGKGLVQNIFDLTYNTKVKITIAKYYIPSGRCIQAIDYSHRNEDGSVGKVPDSLISAFKTKNGRIVYDGGGINPDVVMEPEKYAEIAFALMQKQIIFDYATKFRKEHQQIASAKDFRITDEIYNDFVQYVVSKEFEYQTKSEKSLDDFKKTAEDDKYYDRVKAEFENLKAKLIHNKKDDLNTFRKQISRLLIDEIIPRYYYQKGAIEASLVDDPEVLKAIELFRDKQKYQSILGVKK